MLDSISLYDYPTLKRELGSSEFKKLRASFICGRNPDVERFLREEASKYEKDCNTSNYILFDSARLEIAAYFTLSIHSIIIDDLFADLPQKTFSIIRGYGKRDARSVGCYLIGQLARNDRYSKDDISGTEILHEAKKKLFIMRKMAGGRFVAIDCVKPLIPFYEDNGFAVVNQHQDLFTMIMPIFNLNEDDLKNQ